MLLLLIFLNVNRDVKTQGERVVVEFGYLKKPSVTLNVIISVYL